MMSRDKGRLTRGLQVMLLGVVVMSLQWTGISDGGHHHNDNGTVTVRADKWVSWNGPSDSTLYMQVDGEVPSFFAAGSSGIQGAPWMTEGHIYTFILLDANGNEIARDHL